jgi:hypothetical protein
MNRYGMATLICAVHNWVMDVFQTFVYRIKLVWILWIIMLWAVLRHITVYQLFAQHPDAMEIQSMIEVIEDALFLLFYVATHQQTQNSVCMDGSSGC